MLSGSAHLRRSYARVLAAGIARRPENHGLSKAGLAELTQEGAAFPGSSHSGEPLRFGEVIRFAYRFLQDKLRGVDVSARLHDPR